MAGMTEPLPAVAGTAGAARVRRGAPTAAAQAAAPVPDSHTHLDVIAAVAAGDAGPVER